MTAAMAHAALPRASTDADAQREFDEFHATFDLTVTVDASNTQANLGIGVHSYINDTKPDNDYVEVAINRL